MAKKRTGFSARENRQVAEYEAELDAKEHAERRRLLAALPQSKRAELLSASLADIRQAAAWWQEQPQGAVELANLIDDVSRIVGNPKHPLVDVTSLGDEGAQVAKRMHTWLHVEDSADFLGEQFELTLPEPGRGNVTIEGIGQRLEDGRVWRRNLVRRHLRACEAQHIGAGRVGRFRETIISDETRRIVATRWKHQQQAIKQAVALSDTGDEVPLWDIINSSNANHRVRFAELVTRCKGFEFLADELGHCAIFATLTCPSRFHPTKTKSEKRRKGQRAYRTVQNPAWTDAGKPCPREANRYLGKVWSRTRAAAARRGLRVYGLRAAEPHADGCPHWHLMLWGQPLELDAFVELFQFHACKEDADELRGKVWTKTEGVWRKVSATKARFDFMAMAKGELRADGTRKGGATAYLLKYLTKNLDGLSEEKRDDGEHKAIGDDFEGDCDTATGAEKARAWASVWGIRQFQFYGGAPVSIWRELRRLKGDAQESVWLDVAVEAADKGDWALFCKVMGGPLAKRAEMPLSLARVEREGEENRYGEQALPAVKGVQAVDNALAVTKTKRWKIEWRPKRRQEEGAEGPATRTAAGRAARAGRSPDHLGLVPITVRAEAEGKHEAPETGPLDEYPGLSEPPPWAFAPPEWLDHADNLRRCA